jgi:glutamine synthetase
VRHGDGPTPGYAFTNWASGYGDVRAVPDLGTLRTAARLDRSAVVLCDCVDDESGGLVEVAPLGSVLRRQLDRLRTAGFTAKMGSELEFFLFKDYLPRGAREELPRAAHRRRLRRGLPRAVEHLRRTGHRRDPAAGRRVGDPGEFSKGEWGPGQHEINLRYAEALEMADRHVLYKTAAKEIAAAARPLAHLHGEVERRARGLVAARAHEALERARPAGLRGGRRSVADASGTSSVGSSRTRAS